MHDETVGCFLVLIAFLLMTFIGLYVEGRKQQRRYERARLAYSAERMRRVHRLEM